MRAHNQQTGRHHVRIVQRYDQAVSRWGMVRVPPRLRARLDLEADRQGISMTAVLSQILSQAFEREEEEEEEEPTDAIA